MMCDSCDEQGVEEHKINEESSTTKKVGLSDYLTKTLVRDFEQSGDNRKDFDLLGFCNNNEDIYGPAASVLRRKVQKRFGKINARPINVYIEYLKNLGIEPGPTTLAEFEEHNKKKNKKPQSSSCSTSTTITSAMTSGDDTYYTSGDLTANLAALSDDETSHTSSISSKSASCKKSISSRSNKKPPTAPKMSGRRVSKKKDNPADMFASPKKSKKLADPKACAGDAAFVNMPPQHVFGKTSRLVDAFAKTSTPEAFTPLAHIPVDWLVNQDGTKENPWIVEVNLTRAEGNRDFDIEFVAGIDQDDIYTRNGFHIRKTVAAPDFHLWEATIPQHYLSQYSKRIILVTGPSRDYWQRSSNKYHATTKVNCPATKKAHSATEIAVEKLTARQLDHFLLCFPPEVVLENQIFSNDEETVPVYKNPMMLAISDADNVFEKDMRALILFWRIAVKGGTKVGRGVSLEESKTLFA
jgi:hypothetical protein